MRIISELIAAVYPQYLGPLLIVALVVLVLKLVYRASLAACAVWLSNKALNRGIPAETSTREFYFKLPEKSKPEAGNETDIQAATIDRPRPTQFGEALRQLRLDRHLKLADVAKTLGISASQVSGIENGLIKMSDKLLVALLNEYKLTNSEAKILRDLAAADRRDIDGSTKE